MMEALYRVMCADPDLVVRRTKRYAGASDLLVLFGVGAPERALARDKQVRSGRHCILWDIGYFGAAKTEGYLRVSIDHDHPQAWLDRTPNDSSRFQRQRIQLSEVSDGNGHIVLVGLGRKSRSYLGCQNWERDKLAELRRRFPGRRVVYRPKPNQPRLDLDCEVMAEVPIGNVLRGAALVATRHSNVAIDAAIAGVPFECEDGAAQWLAERSFTPTNRLDFLRRLAWWNWHAGEAVQTYAFLKGMIA